MNKVKIGDKVIGENEPVFIVAEIGINHNGDLKIAKQLIDIAVDAGADAVKFQKRNLDICVPQDIWHTKKETPLGIVDYIDYKRGIEFEKEEYDAIDGYCEDKNIMWFASCWDESSVEFISQYNPPCYKIASPSLTDDNLLKCTKFRGKPIILSTGMSTIDEIKHAVDLLGENNLVILHCMSTYPSKISELNLRVIQTLQKMFNCPIGYSGHEAGVSPSIVATTLGACMIERHITLDRAMWGSDQAASLEPHGLHILVRDLHEINPMVGDGVKKVYDSEIPIMKKLRRK